MNPALFLLGHGTRDADGVAECRALAQIVADAEPGIASSCGFLELAEPHVDDAIDELIRSTGAREVVAVPYVLFGAGHLKDDGPATLARARRRHPDVTFHLARDLGTHPAVLAVAEDRARTVERHTDAVILVGRGSTDPDANAEFVKAARLLEDSRGLGLVHPAFVQLAPPDVATALDRAHCLGATSIAVVPLFLFTGVLVRRIGDQAAAWAADHPDVSVGVRPHLGADERLADLVLERYREAVSGDVRMNCDCCAYRVRLPGYEDKVALPLTIAPPDGERARGWRARRAAAQAERAAKAGRERPRRGLGRAVTTIPPAPRATTPAIEVERLAYAYPDGGQALHGIDLRIDAGERVALLGPNGAGKTTLLLHLLGVAPPGRASGLVRVCGLDVDSPQVGEVRRRLGVVFQNPDDQLFLPTVGQDVAFGPRNLGLPADDVDRRVTEALDAVGLPDLVDRPPHHLSIGQRRRAAFATVLAMHPHVLVLDEPTADLDPAARRDLLDVVHGLDLTIVVVTHDLPFAAELCSRSVVIDGGVVVADGPTPALLANREFMAAHRLELPYGFRPNPLQRR